MRLVLPLAALLAAGCSGDPMRATYAVPTRWTSSGRNNPPVPVTIHVDASLVGASGRPVKMTIKGRGWPVPSPVRHDAGGYASFSFELPRGAVVGHVLDRPGVVDVLFENPGGRRFTRSCELVPADPP
jgi:hypothetical protein